MLEWLRRLVGAREKPDPRELLGLVEASMASPEQPSVPNFDLYTLLEDEKIGREIWPYILAFVARDMKLTYFDRKDEEYLFWKIEALGTWIEMALNSETPSPDSFPSLRDYVRVVNAQRLLAENLKLYMLAVARRSTHGFERLLQTRRHFVVSYGGGGGRV